MEINTIDKENMRQVILDSAHQLTTGLALGDTVSLTGSFENIIVCAMGGSALPANIVIALNALKIPLWIHRDYDLPQEAHEKSLIVCISYSGNTEEAVSSLQLALEKNMTVVGMASGGKIEEICTKHHLPFVKIPSGIQPRSATGYLFAALVRILEKVHGIETISQEIPQLVETLASTTIALESSGKALAEKLIHKIPVIYTSSPLRVIAQIWKIKFNENAKTPAFYNYFPELNHNEMVGYTTLKPELAVVILKHPHDHPRTQKRMMLTEQILITQGFQVEALEIQSGSMLFTIFSGIILGDWTAYYLALHHGIDPTPVEMVETFKKMLLQ